MNNDADQAEREKVLVDALKLVRSGNLFPYSIIDEALAIYNTKETT